MISIFSLFEDDKVRTSPSMSSVNSPKSTINSEPSLNVKFSGKKIAGESFIGDTIISISENATPPYPSSTINVTFSIPFQFSCGRIVTS